ncbi:uncharacterized protein PITG_21133 [Phytophthora infestans T30-4]|uniref:Uncharacterized protein n=2 Tax=Phytophthora infestans TaxID=4787 RepID=D0P3H9_PHYIT|nr:uncharacterized protein PITG_21133 [Phytophthora infestans T30-4]EEY60021.1 hypothetical protein PITG_21133 [Phytophthora infestans T30-4]|eukprot:XP_002895142.1 hypothetical protein PITG_21133 [Phytophthora infestans T30-4]
MVIVSTLSPCFEHRQTVPSSSIPVPTHGVWPVERLSAKISTSSTPVFDLRFHKRSARWCWMLICASVPSPIRGNAVAPCSVGSKIAFGNLNDLRHPIYAYLLQLPDQACLFDTLVATLDAAEPWYNRWLAMPHLHPYNTTYDLGNHSMGLFVSHDWHATLSADR